MSDNHGVYTIHRRESSIGCRYSYRRSLLYRRAKSAIGMKQLRRKRNDSCSFRNPSDSFHQATPAQPAGRPECTFYDHGRSNTLQRTKMPVRQQHTHNSWCWPPQAKNRETIDHSGEDGPGNEHNVRHLASLREPERAVGESFPTFAEQEKRRQRVRHVLQNDSRRDKGIEGGQ